VRSKSGKDQCAPDAKKLKNLIKAYGNQDLELSYSQGYNYIVSLLLLFIEDEEMTFWCLFTIMNELNWRKWFIISENLCHET
jgi:hypothetical protein